MFSRDLDAADGWEGGEEYQAVHIDTGCVIAIAPITAHTSVEDATTALPHENFAAQVMGRSFDVVVCHF